jgi:hypothetical protein
MRPFSTYRDGSADGSAGTNEINAARGWHLGESAKRSTALQWQAIPLPHQQTNSSRDEFSGCANVQGRGCISRTII